MDFSTTCFSCSTTSHQPALTDVSTYHNSSFNWTTSGSRWSDAMMTTDQAPIAPQAPVSSSVIQTVVLVVIWIPAMIGNVLTCLVVYRSRRLQSTTNYFVVSLACVDIILALLAMPFILGQAITRRWFFAPFMCRLVRFIQYLYPGTTSLVFVSISIDRFYTILHPLSFTVTRNRAKQLVIGAWAAAAIIASPCFFLFSVESIEPDGRPFCPVYTHNGPGTVSYLVLVTLTAFVLPVIVSCHYYVRISRFIWRVGFGGRPFQRTTNPVPRAKVKMVKMLMMLNATTALLMAPFFVVQLIACSMPFPGGHDEGEAVQLVAVWIYFTSAASKPILYVLLNSNFRRGCKEMFCMSAMKCYRSHAYTITTMSTLAKKNHVGVIDRPLGVVADAGSYGGGGGGGGTGWTSVSPEFQPQHPTAMDESMTEKVLFTDQALVVNDKLAWPGSPDVSPATFV